MGTGDQSEYIGFLLRSMRALGRRVANADVEDLAEMLQLQRAFDDAVAEAVAGLRHGGRSWGEIAAAVGITRQSAWERWGVRVALTAESATDPASCDAPGKRGLEPRERAERAPAGVIIARSA